MTLQDTKHLRSGDTTNLGDAVIIAKQDADLGRCEALLGELADQVFDLHAVVIAAQRSALSAGKPFNPTL